MDLELILKQKHQELHDLMLQASQHKQIIKNLEDKLLSHTDELNIFKQHSHDKKHNLEICLADATQHIKTQEMKLKNAQYVIQDMEKKISQSNEKISNLEKTLQDISSILMSKANIQLDGSITSAFQKYKDTINSKSVLSVEAVNSGIQHLMQYIQQLEQDKVWTKTSLSSSSLLSSALKCFQQN